MAECLIRKNGGAVDTEGLTATPNDVAQNETFYGYGTDDAQVGALVNQGTKTLKMDVNGSHIFPAGIYGDGSYAYQEIPTQGSINITPVSTGSFAGISGKYMTGNVVVKGIENLVPENIRLGAFVGQVAGTWQGFVNNDIYTPYWHGVFAPGQSGVLKKNYELSYTHYSVNWNYYNETEDDGTRGSWIRFRSVYASATEYQRTWPAITFNNPIDMVNVKSITIEYRLKPQFANDHTWLIVSAGQANPLADYYWNKASGLGNYESFVLPATSNNGADFNTKTFTLSGGAYYYLNIGLGAYQDSSYGDSYMDVRSVRLNK